MQKYSIVKLSEDHLFAASHFLYDHWHACYGPVLPHELLQQKSRSHFHRYLKQHLETTWVAQQGKEILAVMTLSSNCVDELWVSEKHRRRGLGSDLLQTGMQHFLSRGFSQAQIGIESFNHDAIQFLHAMHWRNIGSERIQLEPGKAVNALVYSIAVADAAKTAAAR